MPYPLLPLHLVHSTSCFYGGLGPTHAYTCRCEEICILGRWEDMSYPPSFLSIWSNAPLVSMGVLDQPMHIHVAVRRYAFGERGGQVLSPPPSSPFGPTHLLFLWGYWTKPMHIHAAVRRYAFLGKGRTCPIPPHPLHLVQRTSCFYGGLGPNPCIFMPP